MPEFLEQIDIARSPEQVWQVLAGIREWPTWTASVRAVELLSTGPLEPGFRVKIFQPGLQPVVWTISRWQPGLGFTWESRQAGLYLVADHQLTATESGCQLTLKMSFAGLLGGLVARLSRKMTLKYLGLEAAGLKARSESID